MKKKDKKAQVTIFIILGIIILLSAITMYFYITTYKIKTQTEVEKATEKLPYWAQPVQRFIQDCMQEVAIKAFKKIGEHGGYIDFEDYEIVQTKFNINPKEPTESDTVSLSSQASSSTAYWFYMATPNECNDCFVDSLIPSLEHIEGQVNRYMNRELLTCLDNFNTFRKQAFEFTTEEPKTTTKINLNDVDISVNYPVKIKNIDTTVNIDKFKIRLDFDFYHDYLLAYLIVNYQINDQFLEDILTHLISVYSSTPDSNKIPPIEWIDTEASTVTWNKNEVKERISKNLLGSNIPLIQVGNTKGATRIQTKDLSTRGVYNALFLDFLEENFPDSKVNFFYNPSWKFYLEITPRIGDTLKPTTVKVKDPIGFFPKIITNYYEFFYDISFPVIVIIKDDKSLTTYGENGYTFMFALESNIRDNKDLLLWNWGNGTIDPMNYDGIRISLSVVNSSPTPCNQTDPNNPNSPWICPLDNQVYKDMIACGSNCKTETKSRISPVVMQTLFCDYDQKISKNITIKALDKLNNPIKDVAISYRCGNYRSCVIGATNDQGIYIGQFPICIGDGFLTLDKEGYQTKVEPHVSINLNEERKFTLKLEQLNEKEVEAVYINVTNLFRVKRYLSNNLGTINSLIQDIENSVNGLVTSQPVPSDRLSRREANTILNTITKAKNNLRTAKNLIKDINNYYQLDRNKVVRATKLTKEALDLSANFIYNLENNPNYINNMIGRKFTGNINIPSNVKTNFNGYLEIINKELENVQFLELTELVDSMNIKNYRNKAIGLSPTEQVMISVEKVKENQYEQNLPMSSVMVEHNSTGNITLVPGKYTVSITSTDTVGYIISGQNMVPNLPSDVSSRVNIPPQKDMEFTYVGSAKLDNSSSYWTVNENQLKNSKKVRFYLFKLDKVENIEDIGEVGQTDYYSKRYRAYIEPEFLP